MKNIDNIRISTFNNEIKINSIKKVTPVSNSVKRKFKNFVKKNLLNQKESKKI